MCVHQKIHALPLAGIDLLLKKISTTALTVVTVITGTTRKNQRLYHHHLDVEGRVLLTPEPVSHGVPQRKSGTSSATFHTILYFCFGY